MSLQQLADRTNTTDSTISKLEVGRTTLDIDWMMRLADALDIGPADLLPASAPTSKTRQIDIVGTVEPGRWASEHSWPMAERYSIIVPNQPGFEGRAIEGRHVLGDLMNKTYPANSIVLVDMEPLSSQELEAGAHYLIARINDGLSEETVRGVQCDDKGQWWLVPESTSPEFQAWVPLNDSTVKETRILGRVVSSWVQK